MDTPYEEISIPIKIKSRNQIDRMHWGAKSRLKKQYQLLVNNQMKLNKIKKATADDKYVITIASYRKRLIDYDNIDLKQLLDALVNVGFIWDDSPKYIPKQFKSQIKDKDERTLITRYAIP